MSEQRTAEIIPFPRDRLAVPQAPQPAPPLTVSLSALSTALEEQRVSVEAWRSAIHDLSDCMKTLGASLGQFTVAPTERP
jgi:hypothetical protein